MKASMKLLKPILSAAGAKPVGKVVVGTVKGDIHDIGKNLFGMMMEGAGFEVTDLGINIEADTYIEALEKADANILGMSALLTTTMPYMKVVIDSMKERGIRDNYIVERGIWAGGRCRCLLPRCRLRGGYRKRTACGSPLNRLTNAG